MNGSAAPRIDPAAVRATLRAAGLRAQHRFSQNFLADPEVLEAILTEADPRPERRILEIGPGLGLLTGGLLASGASVTAVELDRGLAAFLRERFQDPISAAQLRLIEGDALDQDLVRLVRPRLSGRDRDWWTLPSLPLRGAVNRHRHGLGPRLSRVASRIRIST